MTDEQPTRTSARTVDGAFPLIYPHQVNAMIRVQTWLATWCATGLRTARSGRRATRSAPVWQRLRRLYHLSPGRPEDVAMRREPPGRSLRRFSKRTLPTSALATLRVQSLVSGRRYHGLRCIAVMPPPSEQLCQRPASDVQLTKLMSAPDRRCPRSGGGRLSTVPNQSGRSMLTWTGRSTEHCRVSLSYDLGTHTVVNKATLQV